MIIPTIDSSLTNLVIYNDKLTNWKKMHYGTQNHVVPRHNKTSN